MTKKEQAIAARIKRAVESGKDWLGGRYCHTKWGDGIDWVGLKNCWGKSPLYTLMVIDAGDPWQADCYAEVEVKNLSRLEDDIADLIAQARKHGLKP